MNRSLSRLLVGAGLVLLILGAAGCSKRVPMADGQFEAQQNVVLTLKDGRTLRGKMDPGRTVVYDDGTAIYRAQVESVSEERIRLENLLLVEQKGSYQAVSHRMADARVSIGEPAEAVSLERSEVEQVEQIRFDTWRSVRQVAFWSYAGAMVALLLGEQG